MIKGVLKKGIGVRSLTANFGNRSKKLLFLLTVLPLSYGAFAQHPSGKSKKLNTVKEFYEKMHPSTGKANVGANNEKSLETSDVTLSTIINVSKKENGRETILGEVKGSRGSNVSFTISNGKLEGLAVMPAEEKAFTYSSDEQGIVYVTETDIHQVMCVNLLEPKKATIATEGDVAYAVPSGTSTVYKLQSLPGVVAVAYLDFDGQTVSGSRWAGGATINAVPGNFTETDITNIWKMISEDYRPFNVNITTDEAVFNAAPKGRRMRCIFTPTNTAAPGSGGVAYVNSFTFTDDTPCWVFNSGAKAGGEAGAHELGHTFGLSHDGRISPSEGYYAGQGIWAPIMGVGYSKGLVQWSKGEYTSANQTQDDIAIISGTRNGFGFRPDEAGNVISAAKVLVVGSTGTVTGSQNYGIVSQRTDVDVYSFTTAGGTVNLMVNPSPSYPDLDILATLTNSSGMVLATSNPTATAPGSQTGTNPLTGLSASFSLSLAAGTYYLQIDGTGQGDPLVTGYSDYASLGEYTISGTIPVSTTGNQSPTVSITSPANNAPFTAPASITITANAADADGTITSVQFFNGAILLGSDAAAPYSFVWTNVAAGTYTITARATDNSGAITISAPITVVVNPASNIAPAVSITSPVNNANYTAPASFELNANATDSDGTVSSVQFFNGSTLIATDVTSPYGISVTNVAAGTYTFTARATDNSGALTTSSPVTVVVNPASNIAPAVSITSPANNSSFVAPATITITANATDSDGTVSSVEFFNGATLLGTAVSSPYSFVMTNVPAGTYAITARATDNRGAVTTSSMVSFTVSSAPAYVTLQAETACAVTTGILNESKNAGFHGTGYVNTDNATGTSITWAINSTTSQAVGLTIRYANITGNRTASLKVNGVTQISSIGFVSTGAWTAWNTVNVTVNLASGINSIQLVALTSDGCANIDELIFNSGSVSAGSCAQASMAQADVTSPQAVTFPNPTAGAFTLTVPEAVQSFTIINDLGITVFRGGAIGMGESIDLPDGFTSGIHVVNIQYESGKREQKKVQIAK